MKECKRAVGSLDKLWGENYLLEQVVVWGSTTDSCWWVTPLGLSFEDLHLSVMWTALVNSQYLWKHHVCVSPPALVVFWRWQANLINSPGNHGLTLICALLLWFIAEVIFMRNPYLFSFYWWFNLGEFSLPLPAVGTAGLARELKIILFLTSNKSSTHQIISPFITVPPHQKATAGKFVRSDISCRYNWAKA